MSQNSSAARHVLKKRPIETLLSLSSVSLKGMWGHFYQAGEKKEREGETERERKREREREREWEIVREWVRVSESERKKDKQTREETETPTIASQKGDERQHQQRGPSPPVSLHVSEDCSRLSAILYLFPPLTACHGIPLPDLIVKSPTQLHRGKKEKRTHPPRTHTHIYTHRTHPVSSLFRMWYNQLCACSHKPAPHPKAVEHSSQYVFIPGRVKSWTNWVQKGQSCC